MQDLNLIKVLQRNEDSFINQKNLLVGYISHNIIKYLTNISCELLVNSFYSEQLNFNNDLHFIADLLNINQQEKLKFVDNVIFIIPKTKLEALMQYNLICKWVPVNTNIYLLGSNDGGIKSISNVFSNVVWSKIDNSKRCSLLYSKINTIELKSSSPLDSYIHPYDKDLTVTSLPGVFSPKNLDLGTSVLLDSLTNIKLKDGKVLDYACGAGTIGLLLQKQFDNKLDLTLIDNYYYAIESAKNNFTLNQLTANFILADRISVLKNSKFDEIITNPPFHKGKEEDFSIVINLIEDSLNILNNNGILRMVANRHLPYHDLLLRYFKKVKVLEDKRGFKVYWAQKA